MFEEKKMFYNIDEHSEGPLHHWLKRLQLVAWHLSSYDTIHGQKYDNERDKVVQNEVKTNKIGPLKSSCFFVNEINI